MAQFVLDEIASMPLELQAKLLRAIEELFPYGWGTNLIKVDVQIIAAPTATSRKDANNTSRGLVIPS
jgi:DNA-binding NtrC family response regulator